MPTVLDKIVATKQAEIVAAKTARPVELLQEIADAAPPPRDFFEALAAPGPIKLIAEVKKASPSAGVIRADFDPVAIAQTYERHGATCLSVLTDEHYFQGHLDYLTGVKQAVSLPVLRKDFVLDLYQLVEARAAGADAVLLIAECLDQHSLCELFNAAVDIGLTPLVELYEPENLSRVLACGARLIGVNNRNLHTFEVRLEHTLKLRALAPEDVVFVSESGIKTHADVERLQAAGVHAILVGESLMREPDIGAAVDRLLARP